MKKFLLYLVVFFLYITISYAGDSIPSCDCVPRTCTGIYGPDSITPSMGYLIPKAYLEKVANDTLTYRFPIHSRSCKSGYAWQTFIDRANRIPGLGYACYVSVILVSENKATREMEWEMTNPANPCVRLSP